MFHMVFLSLDSLQAVLDEEATRPAVSTDQLVELISPTLQLLSFNNATSTSTTTATATTSPLTSPGSASHAAAATSTNNTITSMLTHIVKSHRKSCERLCEAIGNKLAPLRSLPSS